MSGSANLLLWGTMADVADYSERQTHRRATALIMAVSLFCRKFGLAMAGSIQAWFLA